MSTVSITLIPHPLWKLTVTPRGQQSEKAMTFPALIFPPCLIKPSPSIHIVAPSWKVVTNIKPQCHITVHKTNKHCIWTLSLPYNFHHFCIINVIQLNSELLKWILRIFSFQCGRSNFIMRFLYNTSPKQSFTKLSILVLYWEQSWCLDYSIIYKFCTSQLDLLIPITYSLF